MTGRMNIGIFDNLSLDIPLSFELLISPRLHVQAQHLARLTLREHLKGPAAYLTVGGEPLRLHARVDDQFK